MIEGDSVLIREHAILDLKAGACPTEIELKFFLMSTLLGTNEQSITVPVKPIQKENESKSNENLTFDGFNINI